MEQHQEIKEQQAVKVLLQQKICEKQYAVDAQRCLTGQADRRRRLGPPWACQPPLPASAVSLGFTLQSCKSEEEVWQQQVQNGCSTPKRVVLLPIRTHVAAQPHLE